MSKLSIYENRWIEMIFEDKNKNYGAYQLRKESERTLAIAFFVGLLFVLSLVMTMIFIKNFTDKNTINNTEPITIDKPIHITKIQPFNPKVPEKTVAPIVKKTSPDKQLKDQLVNPTIVKPVDATNDIVSITESTSISKIEGISTENINSGSGSSIGTDTSTSVAGSSDIKYPNTINTINTLDKLPEFPGGIEKFYRYVGNKFETPEINVSKTINVYVSFVIEKDGTMTDIVVIRDPGYGLGQEAIRVLKSLRTKWSPGFKEGQPVRTLYNLPIAVKVN
jgi:protein TonB